MYRFYNPNPCKRYTGDCVIRAVTAVENISWDEAYISLCIFGYVFCNWGNGNEVWSAYLRYRGYTQHALPNNCPVCYTVQDFCREHPQGSFILGAGNHAVAVIDGDYYDTGDSGTAIVDQYYTKERW